MAPSGKEAPNRLITSTRNPHGPAGGAVVGGAVVGGAVGASVGTVALHTVLSAGVESASTPLCMKPAPENDYITSNTTWQLVKQCEGILIEEESGRNYRSDQ